MQIRVGTRSSKLALWQTNYVIKQLQTAYPQHSFEIVEIKTKGDRIQNVALQKIGDKGLFVKEIEEQLLQGKISMAVHSMKDMPSQLPQGLCFAQCWSREDPRDVIITRKGITMEELPKEALIGTGSRRRCAQLKKLYPQYHSKDIRGNVDTRLRKLDAGEYDAIIMAAAGLHRLGLSERIIRYLSVEEMIPACAQGALAIEVPCADTELLAMINALADEETDRCVKAERQFLAAMDGNCHVPVGAYCQTTEKGYELHALYGINEEEIHLFHGQGADTAVLAAQAITAIKKAIGKKHG